MRRYSNTAVDTTLSAGVTSADTTIPLAAVTGWPVPETGETALAVIEDELISYTGISGNSLTGCTRGADGTTAVAHSSGVAIKHAGSMRDLGKASARTGVAGQSVPVAGLWFQTGLPISRLGSSINAGAGTLYLWPFGIDDYVSIDALAARVGGVGAGFNFRLGVYDAAGTDGLPANLIVDAGEITVASTGWKAAIFAAVELKPGPYWLALLLDTSMNGSGPWLYGQQTQTTPQANLGGAATPEFYNYNALTQNQAYGALPATVSPVNNDGWSPVLAAYRVA